ncbi:MAG: EAL domain-containing protein [Roseovarius sp.]
MSVNLWPKDLGKPNFVDRVQRLIGAHDVRADRLELEFTEGAVAADDTATLARLGQIRELGVTVAIDEFGSGYSNMAYLTEIPAEVIKIDKGFVQHVQPSGQSGFLPGMIADLAHGPGFRVVGEGVETTDACDCLRRIGCTQAQGHYSSDPLPVGAITDWLKAHAKPPRELRNSGSRNSGSLRPRRI